MKDFFFIASILWYFYPTLGCHKNKNVLETKSNVKRLISMDGLTLATSIGQVQTI